MSALNDAKTVLKTILQSTLNSSFNYYDDWNDEGYTSPFIVIIDYTGVEANDTTGKSKRCVPKFDILIGKDYACRGTGETEKEFIQTELEKLFALSYTIQDDIIVYKGKNKSNNCRNAELTLIKY